MLHILWIVLLGLLAGPVQAQEPPHNAWGGPDSPGWAFGGDPAAADRDGDRRLTGDEFWRWARGRAERMDRDRDHALTPEELGLHPAAPAMPRFRAADRNRDGRLSMDELEAVGMDWFRARGRPMPRGTDMVLHLDDLRLPSQPRPR